MAVYYPSNCNDAIPEHFGDECGPIEQGRVRSVGLMHKDLVIATPGTATEWLAAIAAKTFIVIPNTSGSFDGGSPKEGPGFGDVPTRTIGSDYSVSFKDPNWAVNRDFWNAVKENRNYAIVIRTETSMIISGKPCNWEVKMPVGEDVNSDVVWDITAKWSSQSLPTIVATPAGIFERNVAVS